MIRELSVVIGLVFLTVAPIFAGIFVAVDFWVGYQCKSFGEVTEKETRYMNFDSCYVKTPSGWQRWDEYKVRAMASEAAKELK